MSLQSLPAAVFFALTIILAPGLASAQVRSFGDWTVACDQTLTCEAINVSDAFAARTIAADPPDLPGGFGLMKMERAGEADAPAVLTVTFNVWGEVRSALPGKGLTLHVSDPADEERTGRGYRLEGMGFGRYRLSDDQLAAFLAESRRSDMAAVRLPNGELYGLLTTKGLAATLRYVDEAQGRVGRPDALVTAAEPLRPQLSGGPRPATTLRTRPIFEGAVIRDLGLAGTRDLFCFGTTSPKDKVEARSWRLADGPLLIAVPCAWGTEGESTLWVLRDSYGDQVLGLPDQEGEEMVALFGVSTVDSARGLLTMVQMSRGFGDCGARYSWGWTGDAFRLAEVKVMGPCLGYLTPDWLTTYRLRTEVAS